MRFVSLASLPEFRFGVTGNLRFPGSCTVSATARCRFSRVAALQYAVLFAPLRFAQEDLNYDFSSELRSFKQTNLRSVNFFFGLRTDLLSISVMAFPVLKKVLLDVTLTYPELPCRDSLIYMILLDLYDILSPI
jgi:hypothetical protein